jgi:hypothetical protein
MKLCWWRSDPASWTQQIQSIENRSAAGVAADSPARRPGGKKQRKKAKKLEFVRADTR